MNVNIFCVGYKPKRPLWAFSPCAKEVPLSTTSILLSPFTSYCTCHIWPVRVSSLIKVHKLDVGYSSKLVSTRTTFFAVFSSSTEVFSSFPEEQAASIAHRHALKKITFNFIDIDFVNRPLATTRTLINARSVEPQRYILVWRS